MAEAGLAEAYCEVPPDNESLAKDAEESCLVSVIEVE